ALYFPSAMKYNRGTVALFKRGIHERPSLHWRQRVGLRNRPPFVPRVVVGGPQPGLVRWREPLRLTPRNRGARVRIHPRPARVRALRRCRWGLATIPPPTVHWEFKLKCGNSPAASYSVACSSPRAVLAHSVSPF